MTTLSVIPVRTTVVQSAFDLHTAITSALRLADITLQHGDVLAISSKYVAISEGRVVNLNAVTVGAQALALAKRYGIEPRLAQLVVDEADHIFGGIPMGYLLTARGGVIAPNAGIDRSNIPGGQAVLLPERPFASARAVRLMLRETQGVDVGVILTDSWLMPGRWGTTGVAIAADGFEVVQDERGKNDLFGNPMTVTQRGIADSLSVCAQVVMGERDESTPIAVIRNSGIQLSDALIDVDTMAIDWAMCIYVESLTLGLLPDGAPAESLSARLVRRGTASV